MNCKSALTDSTLADYSDYRVGSKQMLSYLAAVADATEEASFVVVRKGQVMSYGVCTNIPIARN